MTEQEQKIWSVLSIAGPIFVFFVVLLALIYLMAVPLVLAVVIACLLAIGDYVMLQWLMRRKNDPS